MIKFLKRCTKNFFRKKFFDPKNLEKRDFLAKNREKMAKSKNVGRTFFLVGINSKCFETYFITKISKSKIFSHYKFFVGLRHLLPKITKMVKNWQSCVENTRPRSRDAEPVESLNDRLPDPAPTSRYRIPDPAPTGSGPKYRKSLNLKRENLKGRKRA